MEVVQDDLQVDETPIGKPSGDSLLRGQQVIVQETYEDRFLVEYGRSQRGWVDCRALTYAGGFLTSSSGLKLCYIPPGEFLMGSPAREHGRDADEQQRRVKVRGGFYLGATEVTVAQFREFVKDRRYRTTAERNGWGGSALVGLQFQQRPQFIWSAPGFQQREESPVVQVSWQDVQAYLDWLSEREGQEYRLPTDVEWEYACRAGSSRRYWHGDDAAGLVAVGNVADRTAQEDLGLPWGVSGRDGYAVTAPVGSFRRNPFGLWDMHGNVWEWCEDPMIRVLGAAGSSERVVRGGAWDSRSEVARSANRNGARTDFACSNLGFRIARSARE